MMSDSSTASPPPPRPYSASMSSSPPPSSARARRLLILAFCFRVAPPAAVVVEAFAPPPGAPCTAIHRWRCSRRTTTTTTTRTNNHGLTHPAPPLLPGGVVRQRLCHPSPRPESSSTTRHGSLARVHSGSSSLVGLRAALEERDAEREESATDDDDDDDDARDLEDARGASAVLNWARRTLGWFGAPDDVDESSSTESSAAAGEASPPSSEDQGGFTFSFPWFTVLDPSSDEYKSRAAARELRIDSSRDLTGDGFGPLLPVAEKVDQLTGGWGLSYADLTPETPKTPLGVAFLATNAFYALAGLALTFRGELVLGTMTEIAGIVSFWYHYSQLEFGQNRSEVRLALLTDYMTAGTALITGGLYMVNLGVRAIPLQVVLVGGLSVACLTASWVWEFGYAYLFWHSLWHIFSAYAGYLVGRAHLGPEEAGGAGVEWAIATATSLASGGNGNGGAEGAALGGLTDWQATLSAMLANAAPHSVN